MKWGRRLAWTRMPGLGPGDRGFKSRRPHSVERKLADKLKEVIEPNTKTLRDKNTQNCITITEEIVKLFNSVIINLFIFTSITYE